MLAMTTGQLPITINGWTLRAETSCRLSLKCKNRFIVKIRCKHLNPVAKVGI